MSNRESATAYTRRNRTYRRKTNNVSAARKNTVLIGGLVLAVFLIAFFVVGLIAGGTEKAYPNVYVNGVNLGGKTLEEADRALDGITFENSQEAITVELEDGASFRVTAAEAGTVLTRENAAKLACQYGKDKKFISRTFCYLGCLFGKREITEETLTVHKDLVAQAVKEYISQLNREEIKNTYEVDANKKVLRFTKGAVAHSVDEAALTDQLCTAFKAGDYSTIQYDSTDTELKEIDFDSIYQQIFVEPKDAYYDKEKDCVMEGITGISFNLPAAKRLYSVTKAGDQVEIPLIYTEPAETATHLKEVLFRDTLASVYTSLYGSSSNRTNNIVLATEAVNGSVLLPDEIFSYNDTVGVRTKEKGYMEAGAYVGGKTVQEVGGGICQVSSSIYYCTLHCNMETVNRECHMFLVDYVPIGLDATVNWGTLDFQFKNSSKYPIKINACVDGNYVYVEILGTKTDEFTYELDSVVTKKEEYETKYEIDKTVPEGEEKIETPGHNGYIAETYRYVYDGNGNLVRKEFIGISEYVRQDEIIKVSKLPTEESPSPEVPSAEPSAEPSQEPSNVPSALPE